VRLENDLVIFPNMLNYITVRLDLGNNTGGYTYLGGDESQAVKILDGQAKDRAIPLRKTNFEHAKDYILDPGSAGQNRHYILMESVALPEWVQPNWIPLGSSAAPFTGSFDGGGYTITKLNTNPPFTDTVGMFGVISGASAGVFNLNLENVFVSGTGEVGGIAGRIENGATISNVSVSGTVTGTDSEAVGGIVGRIMSGSSIKNSFSTCDVEGQDNVGGIVGHAEGSTIQNTYATGNVTSQGNVGGIVGTASIEAGNAIQMNYATGTITSQGSAGTRSPGAGGVVGFINAIATSVVYNVALNDGITGTNQAEWGRVIGSYTGTLSNTGNYARSDLPPNPTASYNKEDGTDVSLADRQTQAWWESNPRFVFGNTDDAPWKWDSITKRPALYWE
jgi:hypothetical protein